LKGRIKSWLAGRIKDCLSDYGVVAISESRYEGARVALMRAVREIAERNDVHRTPGAEGIVFSKDRPLQLHGLLTSYFKLSTNPPQLTVIYNASSSAFSNAYVEVEALHKANKVRFVRERGFRETLIHHLQNLLVDKVFFLVDDILFIRRVNFNEFLDFDPDCRVPSLRLAPHLTHCYTQRKKQKIPDFISTESCENWEKKFIWHWKDGQYDWSYPLSVDGNCFRADEILAMAKLAEYAAPNSFEIAIQWFNHLYLAREGVCYESSKIVNIPFNRVQTENDNISGDISPIILLDYWNNNMEIDVDRYVDVKNISAHQEMELFLRERQ